MPELLNNVSIGKGGVGKLKQQWYKINQTKLTNGLVEGQDLDCLYKLFFNRLKALEIAELKV